MVEVKLEDLEAAVRDAGDTDLASAGIEVCDTPGGPVWVDSDE